jgi:hypothetical protein
VQRRDEWNVDGEVVGDRVAGGAGPAVAVEGLVEEDAGPGADLPRDRPAITRGSWSQAASRCCPVSAAEIWATWSSARSPSSVPSHPAPSAPATTAAAPQIHDERNVDDNICNTPCSLVVDLSRALRRPCFLEHRVRPTFVPRKRLLDKSRRETRQVFGNLVSL